MMKKQQKKRPLVEAAFDSDSEGSRVNLDPFESEASEFNCGERVVNRETALFVVERQV